MKNKILLIAVLVFLVFPSLSTAKATRKPMSPVRVQVSPTQSGISPETIKAGDIIEFKVTASSGIPTDELKIDVDLLQGAKLVSGDLSWTGPAGKNEEKTITLFVRAPENGKGKIRARVSLPPTKGARFSAEALYFLGPEARQKPDMGQSSVKKNSRGRDVIEYR